MIPKDLSYNKYRNKAVVFFSASSVGDFKQLYDFGLREILVSYFYIKKGIAYYEDILPKMKAEGGIFMTDSGAFSFMGKFHEGSEELEKATKEDFWIPYLEEYVAWLRKWKDYIFVAANLDLDTIVGHDIVRKWNKKYFEPLEKEGLQIVYVAHPSGNTNLMEAFEEYCKKYHYVGVNRMGKKEASRFYQLAKRYNVRVHGFAWTELRLLRNYPFFSCDSTSWLSGIRYGTTYDYDGKNFRNFDAQHKGIRKVRQVKFRKDGVNIENLKKEERIAVNQMNLIGWLGFRKEFLKIANLKLHNKNVSHYERKSTKKS